MRGGPDGVRPLLDSGRRVVIDRHAICSECGGAVEQTAPDPWRHAPGGRVRQPRLTLAALRLAGGFDVFRAKFPSVGCSEDEWREGIRRLEAFRDGLAAAGRRRTISPERTLISISSSSSAAATGG